ncbi:MAG: glycosyltransferase, partial [Candidatus Baltobacteraceae bacterium]
MLVRVDGIGDALACTPLIAALRENGHEVSALLSTRNAEVFSKEAFADLHVVERIPWPKHDYTPQSWGPAVAAARARHYDIAIIASEEPLAYTFARAAGVPTRIGFHNGWQKPFKSLWARGQVTRAVYRPAILEPQPSHECATLFKLGTGLHAESAPTTDLSRLRPLVLDAEVERGSTKVLQLTAKWLGCGRSPESVGHWLAPMVRGSDWQLVAAENERDVLTTLIERAGASVRFFESIDDWKTLLGAARILAT